MRKLFLLVAILATFVSLSSVNAYLTNMVNGAEQTTTDVLTTADDIPFVTFTVENSETEPVILQHVSFSCWNINLTAQNPNIQFSMYSDDGIWYPTEHSIFNLNFNIASVINPGSSKTFVVMGNVWENSDGGARFCLGLCNSGNFQVTGQNTGETYFVNMIGPCQDNIYHIINVWQSMHKLSMAPFVNPVEIYQNYYQDNFWVYPGQSFWSCLTLNALPNSVENSAIAFNSQTIFGGTLGQINPGNGNFFVTDYLPGLVWAWHPEYSNFQMSWTSPNVTGVDASFLYETVIQTHLNPNEIQSEYTSATIGNYSSLFGMSTESAQYERVYHPYQAIKLDVNGDSLFTQADLDMCQQYNVNNINLYGTNFNNNSAPNISRSSVIFFYPNNMFDQWLGNVYLNHPQEPLVQNLGIGLPYDGTWPNVIGSTYTQTGNTITVDTNGNCIGVFGQLPNGEDWNTVIFMNGGENLRWSSESQTIEPERIQMDRTQIQFIIPEGLTRIDVQARSLAQYTANDDPSIVTPATPVLHQNFPNPFNPETTISFNLPKAGKASLNIYNVKGQLVKTLVNETKTAGTHQIIWNGTDNSGQSVSSGIYYYKLNAGKYSSTRKMIMMK
ncbi:MAG: FlgD immunoglobulin-like domain containing protein [Patescibacteria group bacterium]|nr:FlgD immunoglobulin-like domain containing protein [Patescibacteria group bacterium]MDD4304342.1 FlgD immunoglobulin-like domain containing protein [Patescibacteria group bacterium]MDD4695605.1 FlgD immunoglobulin-like domain containing protein [Patescibacteria group bacterium]